jgi:hypothetical protein
MISIQHNSILQRFIVVYGILQPKKDFNIPSHLLNKILTTIGTTSTQSEKCSIQSLFNGSSRPDDG